MYRVEALGIRGIEHFALHGVRGRIIERAPQSPELPLLHIEHGHTPVHVSGRDEELILRGEFVHVGRPVRLPRVCVPIAPVGAADLHDEVTVRGAIQELVVAPVAPGDPDEAVVTRRDPVLSCRPLVAGPLPCPG